MIGIRHTPVRSRSGGVILEEGCRHDESSGEGKVRDIRRLPRIEIWITAGGCPS